MASVTPIFAYDTVTKILSIRHLPGGSAANIAAYDPVLGTISDTLLSAQGGGNVNNSNSGSGSDFDHNLTYTIPANFMVANRLIRVSAHLQITTGSAPPNLTHKLKLGSTVIGASGAVGLTASVTNQQIGVTWLFQSTQAPGASANVLCTNLGAVNQGSTTPNANVTAMPVVIATNAPQILKIATQWSAVGTGTTTVTLNQFVVEQLN